MSVDLNNDASLLIDIPDALCERDKVKFTVHTKVKSLPFFKSSACITQIIYLVILGVVFNLSFQTTLSSFQKQDFSVPRQHEDFIWLHDTLVETEDYAGLIVSLSLVDPAHTHPQIFLVSLCLWFSSPSESVSGKMQSVSLMDLC